MTDEAIYDTLCMLLCGWKW